jgi:hypothetical protein
MGTLEEKLQLLTSTANTIESKLQVLPLPVICRLMCNLEEMLLLYNVKYRHTMQHLPVKNGK